MIKIWSWEKKPRTMLRYIKIGDIFCFKQGSLRNLEVFAQQWLQGKNGSSKCKVFCGKHRKTLAPDKSLPVLRQEWITLAYISTVQRDDRTLLFDVFLDFYLLRPFWWVAEQTLI